MLFQGHEIGPDIAFFEHEHPDAAPLGNLTCNPMVAATVAEQIQSANVAIDQQALEPGFPVIRMIGVVDAPSTAIEERIAAIEVDLVDAETACLQFRGEAREEWADRPL